MEHLPSWMKSFCCVQLLRLCARSFFYFCKYVFVQMVLFTLRFGRREDGLEDESTMILSNSQILNPFEQSMLENPLTEGPAAELQRLRQKCC